MRYCPRYPPQRCANADLRQSIRQRGFALVNRVTAGDIVITQDYGLASMCLARNAIVLHQDGWEYTTDNIDALLFTRHESRKYRAAGGRTKGPKKRTHEQDKAFLFAFQKMLQG